MNFKPLFFILFLLEICYSQQENKFTNYMYNTFTLNPAYVGSRGTITIFTVYRSQWVGIDGAPQTGNLAVHFPTKKTTIGLGFTANSDKIGPSNETELASAISVTLTLNKDYRLAFGFKAAFKWLYVDFNKLNIYNTNDASIQNITNQVSPNLGAGIYLYSPSTYFGISIPNLLETAYYFEGTNQFNTVSYAKRKKHFYIMWGKVIQVNENLTWKPALLTGVVYGAPIRLDLSSTVSFNKHLSLGISYNLSASYSFMSSFQLSKKLLIGYSYDTDATKLMHYSAGSHEFFLQLELDKSPNKDCNCPRYF